MATAGSRNDPLASFNFIVTVENMRAGFAEIGGLTTETDIIEYREGSEDITVRKLPGKRKYTNISLKRGYTPDGKELWEWRKTRDGRQDAAQGRHHHAARRGAASRRSPGSSARAGRRSGTGRRSTPRTTTSPSRSSRSASRGWRSRPKRDHADGHHATARPASTSSGSTPIRSSIELGRTDVAGFVGLAERGPAAGAGEDRELPAVLHDVRRAHLRTAISPTRWRASSRTAAARAGWCGSADPAGGAPRADSSVRLPARAPFVLEATSAGRVGQRRSASKRCGGATGSPSRRSHARSRRPRAVDRISTDVDVPRARLGRRLHTNLLGVRDADAAGAAARRDSSDSRPTARRLPFA